MREFKGTAGPWVFDHYESLRQASGGSVTLRGTTTLSSGPSKSLEEARANTRLCAAAPELLEALQECFAMAALFNRDTDEVWRSTRDKCQAAIAKALGNDA